MAESRSHLKSRSVIELTPLEEYYNKFNEDKRLCSRRGQVEFRTAVFFIEKCIGSLGKTADQVRILDVGAGTGAYSIPLAKKGYSVTAVEPVAHNLGRLKAKSEKVEAFRGDARNLRKFSDASFDLVLLFGPMYHVHDTLEKKKCLLEAKRVVRPGGFILVSYFMNDYCVLRYGFAEGNILSELNSGHIDEKYHITENANPLYSYVRLEDIDALNEACGLSRFAIVSQDGLSSLIRQSLREMSDEMFEEYMRYHLSVCERADMLGFAAHLLDMIRV